MKTMLIYYVFTDKPFLCIPILNFNSNVNFRKQEADKILLIVLF